MKRYALRALAHELDAFPLLIRCEGIVHAIRYVTLTSVCKTWSFVDKDFPSEDEDFRYEMVTCIRCLGGRL